MEFYHRRRAVSFRRVLGGNLTESPPHVRSQRSASTWEGRQCTQRMLYLADSRWPGQTPATLSTVPPVTDAPRPVQEGETLTSPPSRAPWACTRRLYRLRPRSRRQGPTWHS